MRLFFKLAGKGSPAPPRLKPSSSSSALVTRRNYQPSVPARLAAPAGRRAGREARRGKEERGAGRVVAGRQVRGLGPTKARQRERTWKEMKGEE